MKISLASFHPASLRRFLPLAVAVLPLAFPLTAGAALSKIFVASYGNDANDGSRGAPKRNFQAAHNAVDTGGSIVALDTAGYGALTITKAVTVTVPPGVTGFVTGASITINAGQYDAVNLRGLTIESGGPGISVNTAGNVGISDCVVRGCSPGILHAGTCPVLVADTAFQGPASYGLQVQSSRGLAPITVERCRFSGCYFGVYAVDNARVTIRDSVEIGTGVSNNSSYAGFISLGGPSGNSVVSCDNCTATNNYLGFGANYLNTGGSGIIYLTNCTSNGNDRGIDGNGSSKLFTYGNNHVFGNASLDVSSATAISGR